MSFLAPRLRWLSAGGAEPAHETRPVQYVPLLPKMSCNHLCAYTVTVDNHSPRSLETARGKVASNIAFSCIPLFQPPKALSLAPHIFTVRAVTADTGQAGEQMGTRTDWIISGRTLMLAICAAQCMAAALKYWTSTALPRRFCGQSALQQMNRQGQGLLESAPTTWGSFEAEEGP
jgi:hypothetical protein